MAARTPEVKGWLIKKPEGRGASKKRWFYLSPDNRYLHYCKKEGDGKSLGAIDLKAVKMVKEVDKREGSFTISTPERTFELRTVTPEELPLWIKLIQQAVIRADTPGEDMMLQAQRAKESEITALRTEISASKMAFEKEIALLKKHLQEKTEECNVVTAKATQFEQQVSLLQSSKEAVEKNMAIMKSDMEQQTATEVKAKEDLKRELDESKTESQKTISALQSDVEDLKLELKKEAEKPTQDNAQLQRYAAENSLYQNKIRELEMKLQGERSDIANKLRNSEQRVEGERLEGERRFKDMEDKLVEKDNRIKEIENERNEMSKRLREKEEAMGAKIAEHTEALSKLASQLHAATDQHSSSSRKFELEKQDLMSQIQEATTKQTLQEHTINELTTKLSEREKALTELKETKDSFQTQDIQHRSELTQIRDANAVLTQRIGWVNDENERLKKQLDEQKRRIKDAESMVADKVRNFEEQLQHSTEKANSLALQLQRVEASRQSEQAAFSREREELTDKLSTAENDWGRKHAAALREAELSAQRLKVAQEEAESNHLLIAKQKAELAAASEKLSAANLACAELQKSLASKQDELKAAEDRCTKRVQELEDEVSKIRQANTETASKYQRAELDLKAKIQHASDLEQLLSDTQNSNSQIQTEKVKLESDLSQARSANAQLNLKFTDLQTFKTTAASAASQIEALNTEKKQIAQKVEVLEQKLLAEQESRQKLMETISKVDNAEGSLAILKGEVDSLKQQVSKEKEEKDQIATQFDGMRDQQQKTQLQLETAQRELEQVKQEASNSDKDLQNARSQLQEAEIKLRDAQHANTAQIEELGSLKAKVAELHDKNQALELQLKKERQELNMRISDLSTSVSVAQTGMEQAKAALTAESDQVSRLRKEVETWHNSYKQANESTTSLKDKLKKRKSAIKTLTMNEETTKKRVEELTLEVEKQQQSASRQVRDITQQLEAERLAHQSTVTEVQELRTKISKAQQDQRKAATELGAATDSARDEATRAKLEAEQLKRDIEQLKKQVKQLQDEKTQLETAAETSDKERSAAVEKQTTTHYQLQQVQAELKAKVDECASLTALLENRKRAAASASEQEANMNAASKEELEKAKKELEDWKEKARLEKHGKRLAEDATANLKGKLLMLEKDVQSKTEALKKEREATSTTRGEMAALEDTIKLLTQQLDAQNKSFASRSPASSEVMTLKNKIQILEAEKQQLEDDFNNKQLAWNEEKAELETRMTEGGGPAIAFLKQENEALTRRCALAEEELSTRIKKIDDTLEAAQSFLSGKTSKLLVAKLEASKNPFAEEISAYKSHSSMLMVEMNRLQNEVKLKDAQLSRLRKDLDSRPAKSSHTTTSTTSAAAPAPDPRIAELEELKSRYFLTLGRSIKLQGSLLGWYSNVDLDELYETVLRDNIPLDKWPAWVTEQVQRAKQLL
ncbi:hypothetical protein Pelo_14595 [Pelomyxa schiedti]|nr:hypothetical protein Pelo_14595 [Pelomyxa schiedti]